MKTSSLVPRDPNAREILENVRSTRQRTEQHRKTFRGFLKPPKSNAKVVVFSVHINCSSLQSVLDIQKMLDPRKVTHPCISPYTDMDEIFHNFMF